MTHTVIDSNHEGSTNISTFCIHTTCLICLVRCSYLRLVSLPGFLLKESLRMRLTSTWRRQNQKLASAQRLYTSGIEKVAKLPKKFSVHFINVLEVAHHRVFGTT